MNEKKEKFLQLKKLTVASLNSREMARVQGGYTDHTCNGPDCAITGGTNWTDQGSCVIPSERFYACI